MAKIVHPGHQEIKKVAKEIHEWLVCAATDIAYCEGQGSWGKKDARADEIYNDQKILSDLVGDRIFDEAGRDNYKDMILIAEEMRKTAHLPLRRALDENIKMWKE